MNSSLVSIIVVTRERPFLLRHCLDRLLRQSYPRKEVVVVDSSSRDDSEGVLADYPEVVGRRIRGQRNNMPYARNIGLSAASGELIAFVDDDAMVYPGWLGALVDAYGDERVGAVGGRVLSAPEPYCDQASGTPRMLVKHDGRVLGADAGLVGSQVSEVDHLIGCNMSFRRAALEQVGGFDTAYKLTNLREETDLCMRVRRAGWRILFVPDMTVMHFSARSLQPYFLERPFVQFSNGRNSTYFAIKHFGLHPRVLVGQLIVDSGRSCARAIYFAGLFGVGVAAQLAGRVVGVYVAAAYLTSEQRRTRAAPSCLVDRRAPSGAQHDGALAAAPSGAQQHQGSARPAVDGLDL